MAKQNPETQFTPRGHEIPVPKKDDFIANVRKVIAAEPPPKRAGRVTKRLRKNPEDGSK